jgi:hypothetical protein
MICAKCGKLFNGGHTEYKDSTGEKVKKSVGFCSIECKKMYA